MRILVVGNGGREHALCWKIKMSPLVKAIFCAPGNAGISDIAKCIDIKPNDIDSLVRFTKAEEIDLTVVGPELSLAHGIVDSFNKEELRIFGPTRAASEIESSKVFSKNLMKRYNMPTAFFSTFNNYTEAVNWVKEVKPPLVVKASGLASGKGVIICKTEAEAIDALNTLMRNKIYGDAGEEVVIEEFIEGEEVSFFAFTDGETVLPLVSSQDHKALLNGDNGPNTGGMGAYSPAPIVTAELHEKIINKIILPVVNALNLENRKYKGVLYAGLMIKDSEPFVLEFNCRFGDPEAQPLMMRMKSDLVPILNAVVDEELSGKTIEWSEEASVCVVMVSSGYPGDYRKGIEIKGLKEANKMEDVVIFHAGTKVQDGKIVNNGGRVLGVTAKGKTIIESINLAYEAVNKIENDFLYYRHDIGKKAVKYI